MIVAIDTQLAVGTATGAGVYARDLANALRGAGVDVRALSAPRLDPWRFDRRVIWDQVLLPLAAARSGATLLHAASGTMPLVHTLPTIVTVHDVAWLRVQSHTPPYARAYFGALHVRAYRTAAAVVCDSQFSASEYSALVDPRATPEVVYPGVDPRFAQIARRPDLAEPFALVVGTVEARKNLLALIDVLPNVERLRLVSVGPHTPYADAVRRRARELGVGDRVVLRGYVGREELDELYARAICALVPSRYEGFGYALAEAQCAGLPAIAACTSSLVEVACPGTPLVDPDDVASWTDALRALLADAASAERNAAGARAVALQRYSWPAAATRLCSIYERVLSRQ